MVHPIPRTPSQAQNRTMTSLLALVATSGILFFILRYRVHIHIEVTPPPTSPAIRRGRSGVVRLSSVHTALDSDLISALRNLGCSAVQARKAATEAGSEGGFDASLRRAINLAREAA